MRKIDADALKEEFRKIYHCAEKMEDLANAMEDAIDNAPTVELVKLDDGSVVCPAKEKMRSWFVASPTEVVKIGEPLSNSDEINKALEKGEIYKRGYEEGYRNGIAIGKTLNPKIKQGEWIMDNEHTKNPLLWYKCNLCGVYHSPTNFCPICGAAMRKGGRE